jgi:hypothetical protein
MTPDVTKAIEAAARESWRRCFEVDEPISSSSDFVKIITRHLGSYLPKDLPEIRENAAFERGRESRDAEVAALRFELRHALEFLEDLQASDNPCLEPTSSQAATFHMVHSGLFRALVAKAEG